MNRFYFYFTCCCVLGLWAGALRAQSVQELQNSFAEGKRQLDLQNFKLAKESFRQAMKDSPGNVFQPSAMYFFALSSLKTGEVENAKYYLQQLSAKFPQWGGQAEAQYLLADAQMESGDFLAGLKILSAAVVKYSALKESAEGLKQAQAAKASLDKLVQAHREQPADAGIGEILYHRLAAQPLAEGNKALFAGLQKQYGKAATTTAPLAAVRKSSYNVAAVLPFMRSELDPTKPQRRNQFVLDMYAGMELAQAQLEKEGLKINLFAYDTERSTERIAQLAESGKLLGADLIIGPLYPNNMKPLAQYAAKNNINAVNPIGNSADLIKNGGPVLLTEATVATQAAKAAQFAIGQLNNPNAYIYYTNTPDDSLLAHEYKRQIELQKGNVKVFRKVTGRLYDATADGFKNIPLTDSAHVFVATTYKPVAISILSAALAAGRSLPLIASKDWLDMEQVGYEQMEAAHVHFIIPDFVVSTPLKEEFVQAYIAKVNTPPSHFAYLGYETLYYFGKLMGRLGAQFAAQLPSERFGMGRLMAGFDFAKGNDNQFVPICTFRNGQLEVENWPTGTGIDLNAKDDD